MQIECLNCGTKTEALRKTKRFCNQSCRDKYTHIPKPPRGKFFNCEYCKKEIWIRPSRFKFKNHYCCRKHEQLDRKNKSFKTNCVICGNIFYCQPSQIDLRNRKTCSRKCRGIHQRLLAIKRRDEKGLTQHQKDRIIRYSADSNEWRVKVFERDNYTCQHCKKRGGYLEAHHIKPFAYYQELRFEISNGLTLCKKCHNKTKKPYNELRKINAK